MPDQRSADELEIMRLLARLAHAADDRDLQAYRDCLADEVLCLSEVGVWRPESGDAYAQRALDSVSALEWTHHRLCNFVVEVEGEQAHARVDVVAEMQASNGDGASARVTVGGRYDLEFAWLAIGWRITKRHMTTRYTIGDPTVLERARGARHAAGQTSPSRAGPR
jgi:ketosteroid isomerase-like protein